MLVVMPLLSPLPASAASPYDEAYRTTDSLKINSHTHAGICPEVDISTTHVEILYNKNLWTDEDDYDWFIPEFTEALSSGAWVVGQHSSSSGDMGYDYVHIGYNLEPNMPLEWHTDRVVAPTTLYVSIESTGKGVAEPCEIVVARDLGDQLESISSLDASPGFTYDTRNFITYGFDYNYPAGYEGELIQESWSPPSATYVAMGDSFSSGEGNPPFESGTDVNGTNECHRSSQAYPRLLVADPALDLGPVDFVACSEATTSNISHSGQWNEPAQVDVLSEDTEIVTLTVGGNDVGFAEYVTICAIGPCGPGLGQYAYDAIMANINSTSFKNNLKTAYETILEEAENAEVYVLDYPYLFDPMGDVDPFCAVVDSSGAKLVQDSLNTVIALAIAEVRSQSTDYSERLNYVRTNYIGSPFEDRHLCTDHSDGPMFHGITYPTVYSLHPNINGQQGYYYILNELVDP